MKMPVTNGMWSSVLSASGVTEPETESFPSRTVRRTGHDAGHGSVATREAPTVIRSS